MRQSSGRRTWSRVIVKPELETYQRKVYESWWALIRELLGRRTDVSDATWWCQLLEARVLDASFVLTEPIRAMANLTWYRKTQIAEREREGQPAAQDPQHN